MNKIKKILTLVICAISTICLAGCSNAITKGIGNIYVEQKAEIGFTESNTLRIALKNKSNSVTALLEGKASSVTIQFESLYNDDVEVENLDKVYLKKDLGENKSYVTIVQPTLYDETYYKAEDFTDGYYKDLYAMIVDINLEEALTDAKYDFIKNHKYTKINIGLAKGTEDTIQINSWYNFYIEYDAETGFKLMESYVANFNRLSKDIVKVNVFANHKISDFVGYTIYEGDKLAGFKDEWYINGTKAISIAEYTFDKEDLSNGKFELHPELIETNNKEVE